MAIWAQPLRRAGGGGAGRPATGIAVAVMPGPLRSAAGPARPGPRRDFGARRRAAGRSLDQRRGRDEDHDQGLDDRHHFCGIAGGVVCITGRRPPGRRTAARPGRCPRGAAAEQGHGDRVEAEAGVDGLGDVRAAGPSTWDADQARTTRRDQHRVDLVVELIPAVRAANGFGPTARTRSRASSATQNQARPRRRAPGAAMSGAWRRRTGAAAGRCVDRLGDRVGPGRVVERRRAHSQAEQTGDVVEHDRSDDLVRAGVALSSRRCRPDHRRACPRAAATIRCSTLGRCQAKPT